MGTLPHAEAMTEGGADRCPCPCPRPADDPGQVRGWEPQAGDARERIGLNPEDRTEFLATLADAQAALERLAGQSESEIGAVAYLFKGLAARAGTILQQASSIAGLVETESAGAVREQVQSLCAAVGDILEKRLRAATTVLKALEEEEQLLHQLIDVGEHQEAVAVHLQALSVLTNVEVAQLGSAGGDFQLLAQELSAFSKSVSEQTRELGGHTRHSQRTMAGTRREMAGELPHLRRDMAHMERDIETTLSAIDGGLVQLANVPGQFQACAKHIAQQIAGVVSAIQGYDITRQQTEHVGAALAAIASKIANAPPARCEETPGADLSLIQAGLAIQSCQLKCIRASVGNWTSQVATCMGAIQRLSASEVAQIGLAVLNQERDLSSRLAHIEQLQQKSHDYGRTIKNTLGGLSSLLELVNENLREFQDIRHRLQFLTFNSIVEARRLGERGVVVSSIAELIKEVSNEWNAIADQAGAALAGIMELDARTNKEIEVFGDAASEKLRAGGDETRAALDKVRETAAFAAQESARIEEATDGMRADVAASGDMGSRLSLCFEGLDQVSGHVEALVSRLKARYPDLAERCRVEEVERCFGASYTTEIERAVMKAALEGAPLPMLEPALAGNDVELF